MDLNDAQRQLEIARSKLDQMEEQRGNHDEFENLTTELLLRAQSGFESAVDNWGAHNGDKPNEPLLEWLFDIVNDFRHSSQPTLSHADVAAPRSPAGLPEDVKVLMRTRDGESAYFFPQEVDEQAPIPDDYRKIRVTEVAKTLLDKLEGKITANAGGSDIQPSKSLTNRNQRDDHLL